MQRQLRKIDFIFPSKRPLYTFKIKRFPTITLPTLVHSRCFGTKSTIQSQIKKLTAFTSPYLDLARVDKPVGTLLLFYPAATSILMASYATFTPLLSTLSTTLLFLTGKK